MPMFTDKQIEARMRNHRIFRLRGLYYNGGMLDQDLHAAHKLLVDAQLVLLGAESETARVLKRKAEMEAEAKEYHNATAT